MAVDFLPILERIEDPFEGCSSLLDSCSDDSSESLSDNSPDCLEDSGLVRATIESIKKGQITPLLKEELKCLILFRRVKEGREENPPLDQPKPPLTNPTREELKRKERRKELNMLSARRCRERRKGQAKQLQTDIEKLECENVALQSEVKELAVLSARMKDILQSHYTTCTNVP